MVFDPANIWSTITTLGSGGLLVNAVKSFFEKSGKWEEKMFDIRREIYTAILASIRHYKKDPQNKEVERRLHDLFSAGLLYAEPKLREYMVVCAQSCERVPSGAVPMCLGGKGLGKLETLMKEELGLQKTSLFRKVVRRWSKCPCGSGKKFGKCNHL
jgi:hypothetical protein